MKKNYNYTRRKLFLPEYGRHIQSMVDLLLEIEDRAERTRQAKAVIAVMGNLNPMLRDTEDFKHKLWDHLFIMSDFRLDVDSPYPQPSRQDLSIVPEKLHYPQQRIMFKHYGKYVQRMARYIAEERASQDVIPEVANVVRYMRTKSTEFNNEYPNNDSILRDMRLMSGENIDIDMESLSAVRSDYHQASAVRNVKRGKQQRTTNRKPQARATKGAVRHNVAK